MRENNALGAGTRQARNPKREMLNALASSMLFYNLDYKKALKAKHKRPCGGISGQARIVKRKTRSKDKQRAAKVKKGQSKRGLVKASTLASKP